MQSNVYVRMVYVLRLCSKIKKKIRILRILGPIALVFLTMFTCWVGFTYLCIAHFRLVSSIIPKNLKLVFKVRRESDYYLRVESDPKESLLGSIWN